MKAKFKYEHGSQKLPAEQRVSGMLFEKTVNALEG